MMSTVSQYVGSRQQAQDNDFSGADTSRYQAIEGRIVTRIMAKETLKFAREHIPEIDAFVNSLKVEFSSDRAGREETGAAANEIGAENKVSDHKTGEARVNKGSPAIQNKLFFKTGVRVRVESGKIGLVSEIEARYGQTSWFYKVNLDNRGDNSLGFRYVLGKATSLQVERDFNRTMNPAAKDHPSVNVVRLGYNF